MNPPAAHTLLDAPGALGQAMWHLVGSTPLVRLRRLAAEAGGATVLVKVERQNTGGSVKDRAVLAMILDAERRGIVRPGVTLVDATSGNTGISYAWIGAARGYKVRLFLPKNASPERKRILAAYGAEVVFTDPLEGTDGAIRLARAAAEADPSLVYLDQYSNDANWRAHYETTGPEILAQTDGRITHFVAGVGTSGTLVGTGRFLRERKPDVTIVEMQPICPIHGLEGLKHMPSSLVPRIYDPKVAHRLVHVETEEAQEIARRLAREEGIFTGPSGGANVLAALGVAREAGPGAVVVTILPDAGARYLLDDFWTG